MAPLSTRKLDMLYLVFFIIHIPIVFMVDAVPLYPEWAKPQFVLELRQFYIETYKDQFFITPTPFFRVYMVLEVVYHVPLSLWAIGALRRDDHRIPIHLLVYGMQTAVTTLTCLAEALSWQTLTWPEKTQLLYLYGPYLALALVMVTDMCYRLEKELSRKVIHDRGLNSGDNIMKKHL